MGNNKCTWICQVCNQSFPSRRVWYAHKKHTKHSIQGKNPNVQLTCPFCKRVLTTKAGYTNHTKSCLSNPNRIPRSQIQNFHKWTDEERAIISDRMKKLHKEGKAFSWADLSKR